MKIGNCELYIWFQGIEPYMKIVTKKGNCTSSYTRAGFYPIRRFRWKLKQYLLKRIHLKLGYPIVQCEGCGEGIAQFKIQNPNHGKTDWWLVCPGCLSFYGRKIRWYKINYPESKKKGRIICNKF